MINASSTAWQDLTLWSSRLGLSLSSSQLDQLRTYLDFLQFWNRKLALVSQDDPVVIVHKHFADSLAAAVYCADGESLVDLGSGAGFPGLVIAIARPAIPVCLLESRGKKASFLEQACRSTRARNARICNARIEKIAAAPEHRGRYTVATARALAGTAAVLKLAGPLLAPHGRLISMRSVNEDTAEDPPGSECIDYDLPDGTPRRLVIVRR